MPAYFDKRTDTWRYRFRFEGKRFSGTAPPANNTKKGALAAEKRHLEKLERRVFTGKMPTVTEFSKRFLEYQETHTKRGTYERNATTVRLHILPHIGTFKLDEVESSHLDELKIIWSNGGPKGSPPPAADRTVNNRLEVVKRMLAIARKWKLIATYVESSALKIPKLPPRWLNDEESARLLDGARKLDELGYPHADGRKRRRRSTALAWHDMVLVALRTGLRIGELRGLQRGDVDLVRRQIHVMRTDPGRTGFEATSPKSNKLRTVPLTEETAATLRAWFDLQGKQPPSAWVFPARGGKSARSDTNCSDVMGYIVHYAGFTTTDEISWHTTRHTYASQLVARGVHLRVVQDLLGHAHIEQTEVYSHLAPNATHHDAVASLDFAVVNQLDHVRRDSKQIGQQVANKLPERAATADND